MPEVGARAADVSIELEGPACVMGDLRILSNMQLNWLCSIWQEITCHSMHDCIRFPTHDSKPGSKKHHDVIKHAEINMHQHGAAR